MEICFSYPEKAFKLFYKKQQHQTKKQERALNMKYSKSSAIQADLNRKAVRLTPVIPTPHCSDVSMVRNIFY